MNINKDYQKLIGQITSFPTGEIIEPKRKYLENKSFCTSSNLWYLKGELGKTLESDICKEFA